MDFLQICIDISLGLASELISFGDVDLIFKVIVMRLEYLLYEWMDLFRLASIYLCDKLKSG